MFVCQRHHHSASAAVAANSGCTHTHTAHGMHCVMPFDTAPSSFSLAHCSGSLLFFRSPPLLLLLLLHSQPFYFMRYSNHFSHTDASPRLHNVVSIRLPSCYILSATRSLALVCGGQQKQQQQKTTSKTVKNRMGRM